jgi:hypothetical protein
MRVGRPEDRGTRDVAAKAMWFVVADHGSKPKNVKWQMQNVKVSVFNFYILRFYILHFAVESNGTKH